MLRASAPRAYSSSPMTIGSALTTSPYRAAASLSTPIASTSSYIIPTTMLPPKPIAAAPPVAQEFPVGCAVEYYSANKKQWFKANILASSAGMYDVDVCGVFKSGVERRFLRRPSGTAVSSVKQPMTQARVISSQSVGAASSFTQATSVLPSIVSTPAQTTRAATFMSSYPTQTVFSANPSPVIFESMGETAISKKVISREEMIAKGILFSAGSPAPMVTQEAALVTEDMPDYMAVFQGLKVAPAYDSHHFNSAKWNFVQPREDDIIIVTAYKSGTTWMQQIVAEILFQGQEKPATVGDMSPWVDLRVPPPEVLGGIVEGQTWRRFLKTHLPADAFLPYYQPTNKYIYVARDGRDAFMSLLNHYEKGNDAWYGALNMSPGLVGDPLPFWSDIGGDPAALFDKWMTEGWHTLPDETDGWPFWSYFKNVKTWWSLANNFGAENIYFVHFNNMKKDLDGEMRKIAQFLGVPVNEDVWSECVLGCTFEEMQKNADTVAPLNGALWEGGGKSFIFKGTNERWREVLSEEQVAAYEAKAVEELGAECAEFMATGMLPGIA